MSSRSRSPANQHEDVRGPESRARPSGDERLYFKSSRPRPQQERRHAHADHGDVRGPEHWGRPSGHGDIPFESTGRRTQQRSHQVHIRRGGGTAIHEYTSSRRPIYTAPRPTPRPSYHQASYSRPHIGIGDAVRDVRDIVQDKVDDWDARLEAWCNRPPIMSSQRSRGPVEATPGRVLGKLILMPMYAAGKGLSACVDAFATGFGHEYQAAPPRHTSTRHERRPGHRAKPRDESEPLEDLPEDVAPPVVEPVRRKRFVRNYNGLHQNAYEWLTKRHPKDYPRDHPIRIKYERREKARRRRA